MPTRADSGLDPSCGSAGGRSDQFLDAMASRMTRITAQPTRRRLQEPLLGEQDNDSGEAHNCQDHVVKPLKSE